jgi:transposase
VHDYFVDWHGDGTLTCVHNALYCEARELAGKAPTPTISIVDSQSVKGAEKGGPISIPQAYDAGKKIKGARRHIAVDTLGLMHGLVVTPANIQDRDMIAPLMMVVRSMCVTIQKSLADGGYQGAATAADVLALAGIQLKIVKRSDAAKGFVVLPKRWIVERTFGWLGRCRRLAKDFENRR